MLAAFFQFSLNFCSYPQYSTWGGGQANFTGKCTNFLTGAASPARNGAPARCAGAASAAGERPAGRFPPFPRPRAKGRSRPPRLGRRGPAPAKASAPRARGAGRARGARTICTNQSPEKQQGQHRAPGKHRPRSRAANFGGLAPGRGARRPPSGRPFNAAPSSNGGSGGSPHVGRPSPSDEAPGWQAGGHEERVEKAISTRPAASERAAQGARAPPPRRCPAYAGRGCSEGSCCSIRCAAAWRPVVHALPRILLRVIPG